MPSKGESSSALPKCCAKKPVVVRVKRKTYQSRLDALWLEINERPSKRPLLDFQNLSIGGESSPGKVEELKSKKIFVQHVETVNSTVNDVLQSFVPSSVDMVGGLPKSKEQKKTFRKNNKQDQLLSVDSKSQQISAQNARFKQIWRSHKGNKEQSDDTELHDMCHFYDVVRVDVEMQEQEIMSLEDQRILSSYLPLLREFIPTAATQIESEVHDYISRTDDYVYDYYTVRDDMDIDDKESRSPFPLVQVEDEDFYDGPGDESESESDDSNAEAHPQNEYPDERSLEEDEVESEVSTEESEGNNESGAESSEFEELWHGLLEDGIYDDDDDNDDLVAFDYYEDDNSFDYDDDGGQKGR